jgi:hypothetical protein
VLYSSQDHRTGMHNLDHPVLVGVENTDKKTFVYPFGTLPQHLSPNDIVV